MLNQDICFQCKKMHDENLDSPMGRIITKQNWSFGFVYCECTCENRPVDKEPPKGCYFLLEYLMSKPC
jgi:hypothetical protein